MFNRKPKKKLLETKEIEKLIRSYEEIGKSTIQTFGDFPLSQKTQKGLRDAQYEKPTDIQRECIGLALKGRDILGAAKTGSGKTLAFLIPILESLYLERWTTYDGLGALVITPTRELAYQIFEVLCKIGVYHDFSAGLIIGGKDLKFERKRMDKCNIIICTPGRLLQHMDENPLFNCTNLKILVLDEADRILDLGFQKTVNAIIENLPKHRQTLLFSATQTKSVKDLARLSLDHPVYISVHEHSAYKTPETLQQNYVICDLHDKLNLLWSFIKTHLKQKILVFMATCKQVKYTYETFCRMRPGMTVLALYGSLHQLKRMAIYDEFCRKQHAILLATDIAARGLDFPSVNWVVQLDCPEDVKTYIHRVGRTARYEGNGEALLVLLPSEKSMSQQLIENKIPIEEISINKKKFMSVQKKMEVLCSRDHNLKERAQRAFVSYLKNIFLMKDKSVFNVKKFDTEAFARSLGLAVAPRIRFLSRQQKLQASNANKNVENVDITTDELKHLILHSDSEEDNIQSEQSIYKPLSQTAFDFHGEESDDDVLIPKHKNDSDEETEELNELFSSNKETKQKLLTKSTVAKKLLKKKVKPNKKVIYDDDGKPIDAFPSEQKSKIAQDFQDNSFSMEIAKQIMQEEDKIDKQLFQERVRAFHKEKKMKMKEERKILKEQEKENACEKMEEEKDDHDEILSSYINDLPDPDKINNNNSNNFDDIESNEEIRSIKWKRNLTETSKCEDYSDEEGKPAKKKKRLKKNLESVLEPIDTGLTLAEDEELALHLLSH